MVRYSTLFLGVLCLALLLALSMPAVAAEAKGTIKTVTADKSEFVMTDANAKDWTIHLKKDGKVLVNDKTDVRICWLNKRKIIGRFLTAPFHKRNLFT